MRQSSRPAFIAIVMLLLAGIAYVAIESTSQVSDSGPKAERTAAPPSPPVPPAVFEIAGVAPFAPAWSVDNRHLLYAMALGSEASDTEIRAYAPATGMERVLGRIALQRPGKEG